MTSTAETFGVLASATDDARFILLAGVLLAIGIAAALVADQVKVPGLILFLGLGMLFGSEGPIGVEFNDVELTRTLGTIGLVLILFEGGLSAGWREIRPVVGTALSLAIIGTLITSFIAGATAIWLFDLPVLEGLLIGSAVAATDSAAIFAVLRGSRLRRKLARSLEGESGMNDPVALLLVTGFIEWIQDPAYGIENMTVDFMGDLLIGAAVGIAIGFAARKAIRSLAFPTQGLYPVATIAAAGISYGMAELVLGSGFLAVYMTGLILGTGTLPAKRTVTAFHQGISWVAQISLFFLLGLLVVPSALGAIAFEGLVLSAALIFVARPLAAFIASAFSGFNFAERLMLGWAGLRGAIPIWLATFPVIAGVESAELLFNVIFFVVLTSTLIQGATFEALARRLGVTSTEPALPEPLVEVGVIQELGGEVIAFPVRPDYAAVGKQVKELELPREALVNVIVRNGEALPPRGSTTIEAGDDIHVLVRRQAREEVEKLIERWRTGPIGEPAPILGTRGAPQVFTVRPATARDGEPGKPELIAEAKVARRMRLRRDMPGALVVLADGRYAVTGGNLVAIGGRRAMSRWAIGRAERDGISPAERAWWQEIVGVLNAPAIR